MIRNRAAKKSRAKSTRSTSLAFQQLEPRQLLASVFYSDSLQGNWENWSWATTVDLANEDPVKEGSRSIAVTHTEGWGGFYIGSATPVSVDPFNDEIKFSVHGGNNGNQLLQLSLVDSDYNFIPAGTYTLDANQWNDVIVNIDEASLVFEIAGFVLQEYSGSPQPTYYVDEIELGDFEPDAPPEPGDGPQITIDHDTILREISEGVYGMNFSDYAFADEIDLSVNRWGGNSTTRYNYQNNTTNLAHDWYFENYPNAIAGGQSSDQFIQNSADVGSSAIVTIGNIGWTPTSNEIKGSFSVEKYGAQQDVDPWRPDNGNGVRPDGTLITGNDPFDTSVEIDETFAAQWVQHMVNQFGSADQGGVQYYALDNEPMLWNSTHRDVHPDPASYDEVLAKGIQYAEAIKQVDPTANVLGPVSWGWQAYFYSALDAAGEGAWWENPQDRNAHGGQAFLPWYLDQMAEYESDNGTRLLDYLDIHFYPQGEGIALSPAGSSQTQQLRLESTRALWDPNYVDPSWINQEVNLIPRMRNWIDAHYPGTKLAITEYNWGGTEHVNGALAQADVLGIMGREGVDLATFWATLDPNDPGAYAFRMFRNYDGAESEGSKFGNNSLLASSDDVDQVSVFAAQRDSDDAMTIILINKSLTPLDTPLSLAGLGNTLAEVYTYDSTDLNSIRRGDDLAIENGSAELTLPGYSITLIEVPMNSDLLTVINANDSGPGSLRDAIAAANSMPGTQNIQFAIPQGQNSTLTLQSPLPSISDRLILNALSGSTTGPAIVIDGSQLRERTSGLKIRASGTEVSNLSIINFSGNGIEVRAASDILISDNYVGVDDSGQRAGNKNGVFVVDASDVLIRDNLVSGNTSNGILLYGSTEGVTVRDNLIGTHADGESSQGNLGYGILIRSRENQILDNVISGNSRSGIGILGEAADQNIVQGNLIGLSANGLAALGNEDFGVFVQGDDNLIGGNLNSQRNYISGNGLDGVYLQSGSNHEVINNRIGTDINGEKSIGNRTGIFLRESSNNRIVNNLVSGNSLMGMNFNHDLADFNTVEGNLVGTDHSGTRAIGNGKIGLRMSNGSSDNDIRDNVFSGNGHSGIYVTQAATGRNEFRGNMVGTSVDGTDSISNGATGIYINAARNVVGELDHGNVIADESRALFLFGAAAQNNMVEGNYIGTDSSETNSDLGGRFGIQIGSQAKANSVTDNVIANHRIGVAIPDGGNGNLISQNSIYGNIRGIDLGQLGYDANDVEDFDSGPNELQNSTVFNRAWLLADTLQVSYWIDTDPTAASYPLRVELFISDGSRQGKTLLGSLEYSESDFANGEANGSLNVSDFNLGSGDKIVALVIDELGNTSEFSLDEVIE